MDNEKSFDDILKEKAEYEKTYAPADITEHMLQVISKLPEKHRNNRLLRTFESFKFRLFVKDVVEVAVFAVILFMIPALVVNYSKQDKVKDVNLRPSEVNTGTKASIVNTLSLTNIESVQQVPGGLPNGQEPVTLFSDKDSDKIEELIDLIKSSSDIRLSNKDELYVPKAEPPVVTINMKDGKRYVLVPAMSMEKIGDNGAKYTPYDDRVILIEDTQDKIIYYTCLSKDLADYLNSINLIVGNN